MFGWRQYSDADFNFGFKIIFTLKRGKNGDVSISDGSKSTFKIDNSFDVFQQGYFLARNCVQRERRFGQAQISYRERRRLQGNKIRAAN